MNIWDAILGWISFFGLSAGITSLVAGDAQLAQQFLFASVASAAIYLACIITRAQAKGAEPGNNIDDEQIEKEIKRIHKELGLGKKLLERGD